MLVLQPDRLQGSARLLAFWVHVALCSTRAAPSQVCHLKRLVVVPRSRDKPSYSLLPSNPACDFLPLPLTLCMFPSSQDATVCRSCGLGADEKTQLYATVIAAVTVISLLAFAGELPRPSCPRPDALRRSMDVVPKWTRISGALIPNQAACNSAPN